MQTIKKFLNDPREVAKEALEGLAFTYKNMAELNSTCQSLIMTQIPQEKVTVLVGGGSGHEPLFAGFVGLNLADGAVCGDVFAAPSPDKILGATKILDKGAGVLYLYGNYAGDNMNFDIAAELAEEEGIITKTVRIWDDVASAPKEKMSERRGIAGDVFVIKIAGAASSSFKSLEEVCEITSRARNFTRSIGVALAPGSIPETGKHTFELGPDEMEVGMGLHGEPGVSRGKIRSSKELAKDLTDRIIEDLPFQYGDEVCVLINNLGASTMAELLIFNKEVQELLKLKGIIVHDTLIGAYCTSQEMSGLSLSLMKLDPELKRLYDMPTKSFALSKT